MNTGKKKESVMEKLRTFPSEISLTEPIVPPKSGKTAPGALGEFMARESDAIKENKVLHDEIEAMKSQSIKLDLLVEVPGRKRVLSPDEFNQLKENIRHNELTTPITVRPLSGGKFELISGHNRVQACRELGHSEIFAVMKHVDKVGAERGAFYANLMHSSLPDFEKYQGFKRLMAETGQTQAEIAEESGLGRDIISRLMDFDELPKEARDLIASNPSIIGVTLVTRMKGMPGVVDALKALAGGGITQATALSIAAAKPSVTHAKPETRLIKNGKARVAELVNRKGTISIKFKDPDAADALMDKVEALVREFSANS